MKYMPERRPSLYPAIIALLILCILPPSCKKDKNTGQGTPAAAATLKDVTNMLNVQQSAAFRFEEVWKQSHDTLAATFQTAKWLMKQQDVKNVYLQEDYSIGVLYKSGLWSTIVVTMTGAQGQHLTRGGGGIAGGKGSIRKFTVGGQGQKSKRENIGNNKVLIFVPFNYEFYYGNYPYIPKFEKSKAQLDITLVTEEEATFQVFKTVHEYGLIILDTHGDVDGSFQLYTGVEALDIPVRPDSAKFTEDDVKSYMAQSGNEVLDLTLSGKLRFGTHVLVDLFNQAEPVTTRVKLSVTDEYVKDMPNKLKDAVVFGNHCYSGNTLPFEFQDAGPSGQLPSAWLSAGAASYYGYAFGDGLSRAVDNDFCKRMEDSLITHLVINGDSTGISHLAGGVTEQSYKVRRKRPLKQRGEALEEAVVMATVADPNLKFEDDLCFKLFHSPRYKYGCGTYTDPRDGEVYALACIGDQVWFAENLRYAAGGSLAYGNDGSKIKRWGRLYNYNTVSAGAGVGHSPDKPGFKGICPDSFHIPSEYDWKKLVNKLNAGNDLSIQLKSKSIDWEEDDDIHHPDRNKSGFALLPAGHGNIFFNEDNRLEFFSGGESTSFWGASLMGGAKPQDHPTSAGVITVDQANNVQYPNITLGPGLDIGRYIFYSCRCVRN